MERSRDWYLITGLKRYGLGIHRRRRVVVFRERVDPVCQRLPSKLVCPPTPVDMEGDHRSVTSLKARSMSKMLQDV